MTTNLETKKTTLYLVRHGATDANMKRPYILQGRGINLPLNKTGLQQAQRVASFLSSFPLSTVYSSPLLRARQTGDAIAKKHGLQTVEIEGIQECDVGAWEGMDWGTIMQQNPDEYRAFINDPGKVAYLKGESYGDVLKRTRIVLGNLLIRHQGESIAVVAHNVVNRTYLASILGLDLSKAKDLQQSNGGVNVIEYENSKPKLRTLNACFHMA